MDINTRDFGTVQIEDDAIYEFEEGLYGFEDNKKFAIIAQSIDEVSFLYLQSIESVVPCFLVFEPWDLYADYQPAMSKEDMEICQVNSTEDLIFLVIASVPSSIEELSINIKSPIVLNPKTRKARQVILQNQDYTVRYLPFKQDGKAGS